MIKLNVALELAKAYEIELTVCIETENAYIFGNPEIKTIGGELPIVVLKESGEIINMTEYIDMYSSAIIKEFSL